MCVMIQIKKLAMKKKVLSLFSGCGGMDLGLEGDFKVVKQSVNKDLHPDWVKDEDSRFITLAETSFKTVFSNDILKPAKAAWTSYFKKRGTKETTFHSDSIVDLVKKAKAGEFKFPDNIEVVTGGFPCQDFSVAGKRKGFKSHKSHENKINCGVADPTSENRGVLYMWMREVIELTKPKVFIAENVKGLISMENTREIIENDFRSVDEGYVVFSKVLNAADFGVPQKRERIIFIGFNKRYLKDGIEDRLRDLQGNPELNPYPLTTHGKKEGMRDDESKLYPYVTVKDALAGLAEPENSEDPAQKAYSKAKHFPKTQGNIEVDLNGLAPTIRAEHHGNIEFRRLASEHGGKYKEELSFGLTERRLTVRECARIQTFPDDYEFILKDQTDAPLTLSASGAYKVIGNAVPPLLAYNLAKKLESIWEEIFY